VGTFLKRDPNAAALRGFLVAFNAQMRKVTSHLDSAVSSARFYYTHNHEEFAGRDLVPEITEAHVQKLLDPNFQGYAIRYARGASLEFQAAAKALRENALPHLPSLSKELDSFVGDFCDRYHKLQERATSWVPSILWDIAQGSVSPTTLNIAEVELLPQDIRTVGALLDQFPPLLDEMSIHFLRLSELTPAELESNGYSTMTDLKHLYSTRMECAKLLREIDNSTDSMSLAFVTGLV
jgi:hypothetical protein